MGVREVGARIVVLLACGALAPTAGAATINVTTQQDAVANDSACSLREAINAAVSNTAANGCPAGDAGAPDVIEVPEGVYALQAPTAVSEDANQSGDLDINTTSPLTVHGAGADATTISGRGRDRVFDVLAGAVTLDSLTVTGGLPPSPLGPASPGGGIRNQGQLTLTQVEVVNNSAGLGPFNAGNGNAGGNGGGVWSGGPSGTLTVRDSLIRANSAGDGSAGFSSPGSAFSGGAGGNGGGLFIAAGGLDISGSAVVGNTAGVGGTGAMSFGASPGGTGGPGGSGGGISAAGPVTVLNTTIADNAAGAGGAGGSGSFSGGTGGPGGSGGSAGDLLAQAGGTIGWSTLRAGAVGAGGAGGTGQAGNGANGSAGSVPLISATGGPLPISSSILESAAAGSCSGVSDGGGDLTSAAGNGCPGTVGDAKLGALSDHGGTTPSYLPGAGSAAIDAGGATCPATDQRGITRPQGTACDIGAVEVEAGQITADRQSLSFPDTVVGTTADALSVVVTNPGPIALAITTAVEGPQAGEFPASGCGGTTLAPGAQCTVSIQFAPGAAGQRSATVTVSAGGTSRTVDLSGTGTPPGNTVLPSIKSGPGSKLTCLSGTWTGSPSFAFAWLRDGNPITGATSSTYTPTPADRGHALQCRVTATRDGATAVAISAPRSLAAAQAPSTRALPSIRSTARAGSRAICRRGTWTPGGLRFSFRWLRNGAAIRGAHAATYRLTARDVGRAIQCEVRATGTGGSAVAASHAVVARAAAAVAAIRSGRAAVRRGAALVRLACRGAGRCAGTLTLTGLSGRPRYGQARYSSPAGRTRTVTVRLTAAARTALARARRHQIAARAQAGRTRRNIVIG